MNSAARDGTNGSGAALDLSHQGTPSPSPKTPTGSAIGPPLLSRGSSFGPSAAEPSDQTGAVARARRALSRLAASVGGFFFPAGPDGGEAASRSRGGPSSGSGPPAGSLGRRLSRMGVSGIFGVGNSLYTDGPVLIMELESANACAQMQVSASGAPEPRTILLAACLGTGLV